MPTEQPFDMPASGTFEQRGGWIVRRLMVDAAMSLPQAAGLVGNLGYESRGFTALQEEKPLIAGSKGGYGIAQWTSKRRVNFERWCAEQGVSPASDRANYGFLLFELLGDYKTFAARLRTTRSIEDACHLTHQLYETPSDALDGSYRSGPDRLAWARRALAGATASPVSSVVAGPVLPPDDRVGRASTDADAVEAVKTLQRVLVDRKRYRGQIDGQCGPQTMAGAMAAYNATRGL